MNIHRLLLVGCMGAGWVALDAGCTSCQAPYDYSGPTVGADGKPIGGFGTRVGSAWAGTNAVPPPPTAPKMAAPAPATETAPDATPADTTGESGPTSAGIDGESGGPSETTADARSSLPTGYSNRR